MQTLLNKGTIKYHAVINCIILNLSTHRWAILSYFDYTFENYYPYECYKNLYPYCNKMETTSESGFKISWRRILECAH